MRGSLTAIMAIATVWSSTAMAGPPSARHGQHSPGISRPSTTQSARVELKNDTRQSVDVFIAGVFRGEIAPNDTRMFGVGSGSTHVKVVGKAGNTLMNERFMIASSGLRAFKVKPLRGVVNIENDGRIPLLVNVDGEKEFWLAPGMERNINAPAGELVIDTSMSGFQGMVDLPARRVTVRNGKTIELDIGFNPPPPAPLLQVENRKSRPIAVYVDGERIGTVAPGRAEQLEVNKGSAWVIIFEVGGDLDLFKRLDFAKGHVQDVEVTNRKTVIRNVKNDRFALGMRPSTYAGWLAMLD